MDSVYNSDYTVFKKENAYYYYNSQNKNNISSNFKLISEFNDGGTIIVPLPNFSTIPIVSVDIDTNCLSSPIVNIEFKSLINYSSFIELMAFPNPKIYAPLAIIFQLSRCRNDGSKSLLKSWNYSRSTIPYSSSIIENFNFSYVDKHPIPGNYVYSIDIINANGSLLSNSFDDTESCSIQSCTLSVTALDSY